MTDSQKANLEAMMIYLRHHAIRFGKKSAHYASTEKRIDELCLEYGVARDEVEPPLTDMEKAHAERWASLSPCERAYERELTRKSRHVGLADYNAFEIRLEADFKAGKFDDDGERIEGLWE